MCLTNKKEFKAESVDCWKVFRYRDGKLWSAWDRSQSSKLIYETNKLIDVVPAESYFYGLRDEKTAYGLAHRNDEPGELLVLPVTLYDVEYSGNLFVPSEDVQCLDGYYPSYMGKRTVVHFSEELQRKYAREIYDRWRKSLYRLPKIVAEYLDNNLVHQS